MICKLRSVPRWTWVFPCVVLIAFLLINCGGGGGVGGTTGSTAVTVMSYFTPMSFNRADQNDSATLIITPKGGFRGNLTVSFRTPTSITPGFKSFPNTVGISTTKSTVAVSSSAAISVPLNFSWTSWSAGSYEEDAYISNDSFVVIAPLDVAITSGPPPKPGAITTWHNDGMRTGSNPAEMILNTSNVKSNSFGELFSQPTNGAIEAEPLYVPSVVIPGKGTHNVVYVATLNAMVYAFDADNSAGTNSAALWTANLGPASPTLTGGGGDSFEQGIASTPTIDTSSNTMYVVSKNGSGSAAHFTLHALDITTGLEKFGGPVAISASVSNTKGGTGGTVVLESYKQYQRCGLLLLNGVVYIGIGGLNGDTPPCRGWVLGYNASTLQQTAVFTTAPDAGGGSETAFAGGGVWMSGGGISTDGTYLYCATGNGDFDASFGGNDYGDSVLKLLPSGNSFKVADYFTPENEATYDEDDLDLGSGCSMLVPSSGSSVPLLIQPCKAGFIYVLNTSNMGKFHSAADQVVQEVNLNLDGDTNLARPQSGSTSSSSSSSSSTGSLGLGSSGFSGSTGSVGSTGSTGATGSTGTSEPYAFWSSSVYCNGNVFFAPEHHHVRGYKLSSSGLATSSFGRSPENFAHSTPSASYNSSSPSTSAILWMVGDGPTAVLCAYDAATMQELYKAGTRDAAGPFMKFGVPMVANGKVYVPCQNGLYVYGTAGFQVQSVGTLRRPLNTR